MMPEIQALARQELWPLALAWLVYFLIHSGLAALGIKRRVFQLWPRLIPNYRLLFNATATLLLLPPLWLTYIHQGDWLWRWQGPWFWLANGLALLAMLGFLWSLRFYDGQEFLGFRQLRRSRDSVLDQERFHLSPLHRHVRHPWYFLGLVMIWTRDMNSAWLLSFGLMTAYFVIGSRLEERKLLAYHGETYRRYLARVPGLLPLPWRFLSADEARQLLDWDRQQKAAPGDL